MSFDPEVIIQAIEQDDDVFFQQLTQETDQEYLDQLKTIKIEVETQNMLHDPLTAQNNLLHHAAYLGKVKIVRLLIENGGFFLNCRRQPDDATPLFLACAENHPQVVEYLAQKDGINVTSRTNAFTAYQVALSLGHAEICEILARYRPESRLSDEAARETLATAEILNSTEMKVLFDATRKGRMERKPRPDTSGPTKGIEKNPPKHHLPLRRPR